MFKLVTWSIAVLLGWFSLATMFAEASKAVPALPDWTIAAAPLRGDLLADRAALHAGAFPDLQAASPEAVNARAQGLSDARRSLNSSPHLSRTWLLAARLENVASSTSTGPTAEALRMSYLTGPAEKDLISDRLQILSSSTVVSDAEDLKDLAQNDIRLILTQWPDLKPAIVVAFRHGPPSFKTYLEETVMSLDPRFAATLRQ